jgi:hypothetical protein
MRYQLRLLGHSRVTRAAPFPADSRAFAEGPETPARLKEAVLQRYHSKRRKPREPSRSTAASQFQAAHLFGPERRSFEKLAPEFVGSGKKPLPA